MRERQPSPSTQRVSKRRRVASARHQVEEDQEIQPETEDGSKCANCAKRKVSCNRPSTDSRTRVCEPCRVGKMKCEYASQRRGRGRPRKQVLCAPSSGSCNNSAAQSRGQGTTPASAGHAGAGRVPASSGGDGGGDGGGYRPNNSVSASFNVNVDGQHRPYSTAGARPLPSRAVQVLVPVASSSSSSRAQARGIQPRFQTPAAAASSHHSSSSPPIALDLEDQLDKTRESLMSLKSQYIDTNRARVDALAQLKKAYFRLQNTMGAVSSNVHELEELLLESLQAESQPGHTGMHESFQDKFVGLHAELRDIVVLRAEHDQTVKQYEHLEELSRKHNLYGDVLERMALQTRAR